MAAKYDRIAADLRARLAAGEFAVGEKLPGEADLAQVYLVALPTMRKALAALAADGLIVRRHGLGTFVLAAGPGGPLAEEDLRFELAGIRLELARQRGDLAWCRQQLGLLADALERIENLLAEGE